MKILMMLNCFKKQAAGESYYQLARELVKAGCKVTALLPQDTDTPAVENMDGITVKRFDYFWPQSLHRVAYGLGIPENLKKSWMARFQLPFFMLAFFLRGSSLAKDFDLVHVITTSPGPSAVLAWLLWGKPFVLTVIGSDIHLGPKRFNRWLIQFPSTIISAAREQQDVLIQLGRKDGVLDIKHIIDFSKFGQDPVARSEVREELGLKGDDFVFTFVGRIYPHKDPLTFIRAAALAAPGNDRIKFLVVGHGNQFEEARQLVRELGIEDRLIMTGHRSDIHRILAASDVFCTLSKIYNCFANTILEAMTTQIPVILTDVAYTSYAFPHLKYAYLIPPGDPRALADAMTALLDNPRLRQNLAESGPGCIESLGFNREKVIRRTLDLYQELIRRKPPSPIQRLRHFFSVTGKTIGSAK